MAAAPVKSPLHDFPLTFLKWNTKKDRRNPPSPPPSPPPQPNVPVGSRSSRNRRPAAPEPEPKPEHEPEHEDVEKQWNLRPRRRNAGAASASAAGDAAGRMTVAGDGGGCSGGAGGGNGEKRKFWIALSKDEIEEDIYSITGCKPSRRPRKRPKIVQKHLDNVFPGLWLVGATADSYRNFDPPPLK